MPKISFSKDYKDKSGKNYKPLFARYTSLETWRNLEQIMAQEKLNLTEAIDFAVKRALGK